VYHDRMLLTVRAVTRPEYDAWLASKEATTSAAASASPEGSAP
jgi:heme/copper-type cytochrome/quinol oxidase subunit 2